MLHFNGIKGKGVLFLEDVGKIKVVVWVTVRAGQQLHTEIVEEHSF